MVCDSGLDGRRFACYPLDKIVLREGTERESSGHFQTSVNKRAMKWLNRQTMKVTNVSVG